MCQYFGVIGNRDNIKYQGKKQPFWEFLDEQPDGWLTSLVYACNDLPTGKRMIFDCGAWSYRNENIPKVKNINVTPDWTLTRYQQIGAKPNDFVIAPDHMLIPGVDTEARRRFNLLSAQEFLQYNKTTSFCPMATVHGDDLPERIQTAQKYVKMGYQALALGGLAARASQKALVMDIVWEIRKAVPDVWLHVLGLSSPDYTAAWHEFRIQSFDGSSHFKQAFTAGTFFKLDEAGKLVKYQAARPGDDINAPLCDCKACSLLRTEGVDTRSYGSNEHNMGRAAHNMNMLMKAQRVAVNGVSVLVSCVGQKRGEPSPAGDLYQSDWFRKAKVYAEQKGDRWYILSAEHGLLDPETVVEPYERTLNTMGIDTRRQWAVQAFEQIKQEVPKGKVVILAGQRYREYLEPILLEAGYYVEVPMRGLGIGQQLAWLMEHTSTQLQLL